MKRPLVRTPKRMGTMGKRALGAGLIFAGIAVCATGYYTGYKAHEQTADFTWIPATQHRPAGFGMIVNANLWAWVTDHHGRGWTDALVDAQAHDRLNALVEYGMRSEPGACPGRWLMSNIRPLPDGGVFFSGFCATDDELQKARDDTDASI